ncbi:fasciclin domain-containing protein [Cauispirillum nitrogeniifigens]
MTFKFPVAAATAILLASGTLFSAHAGSGGMKADQAAMSQPASGDIVDVAAGNGSFATLVAAVKAAGLVDTLKGDGPFTVFAPTDDAFAKLPAGTVENLLKPENRDQLTRILTYHVVPGKVTSDQLSGKRIQAATAAGPTLDIDASGQGVMVQQATVTAADIPASNGVIHVIDTVLLPAD